MSEALAIAAVGAVKALRKENDDLASRLAEAEALIAEIEKVLENQETFSKTSYKCLALIEKWRGK